MGTADLGKTSVGMEANVAALLSYVLGPITGLIFFPQERFRIPVVDPALIVCAACWGAARMAPLPPGRSEVRQ